MLLAGCAAAYEPRGVLGGYSDKMIANDAGVVVVSGNAFTAPAKVRSMLMLRAAELTLRHGHRRFSLLSIEDQAALDAQKAGRLPAYLRAKAARENSGPALAQERTVIFSPTAGVIELKKSGGGFFVVMFKDGEGGAYDARAQVARLRPVLAVASDKTLQPASGARP